MSINYYEENGVQYCSVFADYTKSNGILRFTHEVSVIFKKVKDTWKFFSAWHIGVSDMEWNENEVESFNQTFPGVLDSMITHLA